MNYHNFYIWNTLSRFLLINFTILNTGWFVFYHFFIRKTFQQCCPRHSIFNDFNHRNFFIPAWNVLYHFQHFEKIFLYFYFFTWSPILNLRFLSFFSLPKSLHVLDSTSTLVLWYVLLYSLTISSNLSIYTFFTLCFEYFSISLPLSTRILLSLLLELSKFSEKH